jgi:hypothetical protein
MYYDVTISSAKSLVIGRGDVNHYKVHTDHNVADPLMMPLPQSKHEAHMRSMDFRYLHE